MVSSDPPAFLAKANWANFFSNRAFRMRQDNRLSKETSLYPGGMLLEVTNSKFKLLRLILEFLLKIGFRFAFAKGDARPLT